MQLSNHLFWDIDVKSLDYATHCRYIIKRVVTRGTLEDWVTIKDYYGIDKVKAEILLIRDLDPKTHTFFSTIFNIPKDQFRCSNYTQSIH